MSRNNRKSLMQMDMVFKDIPTALDFLYDLGAHLPIFFRFSSPVEPDEYIRASEGGQTIILYKNRKMAIDGKYLTLELCKEFCNIIGKENVFELYYSELFECNF